MSEWVPLANCWKDADVTFLWTDPVVAVLGYASQGRAQALCLREAGVKVRLGLRPEGDSWKQARKDGWREGVDLLEIPRAVQAARIILVLVSDVAQPQVFVRSVAPFLRKGQTLVFAHGFNVHFGLMHFPDFVDVGMLAPCGAGHFLREQFLRGGGVPGLVAVHQDFSGKCMETVLLLAKKLGMTKPGVWKTSFAEETVSNLFAEQAVLCGGVGALVRSAFETLVKNGVNPAVAYLEVHHILFGLIAPLEYESGHGELLKRVSLTARRGALEAGPQVVDAHVRGQLEKVWVRVQSGEFARDWQKEYAEHGTRKLDEEMAELDSTLLELVGEKVRKGLEAEKP
ncbi:MAG: ketol-acid reductoisomerase [Candidatus Diapherotrites archaeon]|nr:ketol-acid reductoisomerase [Candidatus Diapherotrites archaeon]